MSREREIKLLTLHEGRIPYAYQDSLGYWTIGVGHLVDRRRGGALPPHIIDLLLMHDIHEHEKELFKALPWVIDLDEVRQYVLLDMAFNLGVGGLLKFKHTLGLVKAGEYAQAAIAMDESLWARQVKSRATRLCAMMATGQWPKETE